MFEIGHGDNQGHIRIDGSGRVTKPNQARFFLLGLLAHVTSSGDIIFTDVEFNRGSHIITPQMEDLPHLLMVFTFLLLLFA